MNWTAIQTALLGLLVLTQVPTMVKDHRANSCTNYFLENPQGVNRLRRTETNYELKAEVIRYCQGR